MDPETPKPVPMPEQPAYQHRQRPDITKTISDNQITTPKPVNQFNPPPKPALNPQGGNHYVCASKGLLKPGPSHTPPIADNQNNQTGGPSSSAGSTSGSKPALPKPRPLGGFAFPGKVSISSRLRPITQVDRVCIANPERISSESYSFRI